MNYFILCSFYFGTLFIYSFMTGLVFIGNFTFSVRIKGYQMTALSNKILSNNFSRNFTTIHIFFDRYWSSNTSRLTNWAYRRSSTVLERLTIKWLRIIVRFHPKESIHCWHARCGNSLLRSETYGIRCTTIAVALRGMKRPWKVIPGKSSL